MRISFVIPAYNAENFLPRCLHSLEPLLTLGHEAVIVNDGSTDTTPDILSSFAATHPTVQLITQENQGQSVARNVGVRRATGDYIWFLDADDYLDEQIPDELMQVLAANESDVIVIGRTEEYGDSSATIPSLLTRAYASGTDYFREANMKAWYRTQPWDKIVHRSLLVDNDIMFEPGMMFEDMFYCLRVMVAAQKTTQLAIYPYHYVLYNPGSLTKQTRPADYDALTAVEEATAFLDRGTSSLRSSDLAFQLLAYTFLSSCLLKKYIPLSFTNPEAQEYVRRTMQHPLFKGAVRCCAQHPSIGLQRWGMALCIWLSPSLSRYLIKWLM